MREQKLHVTPFSFISILECSITKCVNEHFTAKISGYISEDDADEIVLRCTGNEKFTISLDDEADKRETIFKGVITKATVQSENRLKLLTIEALSYTSLLDGKEMTRTFQNIKQSYRNIVEFISRKNGDSVFIYTKGSDRVGKMVVQYHETDWEFIKRMAARCHTVVVSDCKNDNICLCFGLPRKSERVEIEAICYSTSKLLEEYTLLRKKGVSGLGEHDSHEYIVKSRDMLELCGLVTFQGRPLTIYKIESRLEGNELLHTYYLRSENGFQTAAYNNEKIIGASITGKVLDVEHDQVKVCIDSDDDRPDGVAKWFQYATAYSSPEGASWYCMPERGDKIRVFFPEAEEEAAYVISAIHLGTVDRMRQDPDEKSIRTIFDKEIRFTPTKILITNHKGTSITLDDKTGISITTPKGISMSAGQNVDIFSGETFEVVANSGISMRQNVNAISVHGGGVSMFGLNVSYR